MQTPISRDELRALKAGEDEKKRIEDINRWVSFVYKHTIDAAKTTNSKAYNCMIQTANENVKDIMIGVQNLFPGCPVNYVVVQGSYRKTYTLETIDPTTMLSLDKQLIRVDWS